MIIENANGKFYAPDDAAALDTATGKYSLDGTKLVPYDLYVMQIELAEKTSDLEAMHSIPDEELIQWAKGNSPMFADEGELIRRIEELNTRIAGYGRD